MKISIKIKLLFIISLFAVLFFTQMAQAQQADSTQLVIAKIITIHSKILKQDRKVYIYAPAGSANEALPVLYLMDGEIHSSLVSSEVEYLSNAYSVVPRMIVVATGNYNYDRMHDLTPTHFTSGTGADTGKNAATNTTGGGEQFLQFLGSEVMPYVEKTYKTAPYKVFSGHSLGGLMTVHCLVTHPDMFNAYIAISPSVWAADGLEVKRAAEVFAKAPPKNKILFVSDASEGPMFHGYVMSLDSVIKKVSGLSYKYISYPDETHGTEPVKAEYDGLKFVFSGWQLPPTDTTTVMVKDFYAQLSAKIGYTLLPSENTVNDLGYALMSKPKEVDEAIAMLTMNVVNYPASSNAYDSLGDAYAKKGDTAKTIANYKKALQLKPGAVETAQKLKAMQDKK